MRGLGRAGGSGAGEPAGSLRFLPWENFTALRFRCAAKRQRTEQNLLVERFAMISSLQRAQRRQVRAAARASERDLARLASAQISEQYRPLPPTR